MKNNKNSKTPLRIKEWLGTKNSKKIINPLDASIRNLLKNTRNLSASEKLLLFHYISYVYLNMGNEMFQVLLMENKTEIENDNDMTNAALFHLNRLKNLLTINAEVISEILHQLFPVPLGISEEELKKRQEQQDEKY